MPYAECKHTVDKHQHTDAVSCVKFNHPAICVTASWDKTIKLLDLVKGFYLLKLDCEYP
jgi:WD40 repeat protein